MKKADKDLKKYELKIANTVSEMDEGVKDRFKALAHISNQLADISKQYDEEIKQIEYEAEQADKPLYQIRSLILQGKDFDDNEITTEMYDKRDAEIKDEDYEKIKIKEFKNIKHLENQPGIPAFWLHAMKNNKMLQVQIEKRDEKLLSHLIDIEYINVENSDDFILKFHFTPNDFIENTVITKRYIMEDSDRVKKIDCTKVRWRDGKNLLEKDKPKKNKGKKKNNKKAEDSDVVETFFHFFTAKEPTVANPDEEDLEEEDEMRLEKLEEDLDIAADIRDELVPLALEYYLNIVEEDHIEEAEGEDDEEENQPDGEQIQDGKEVEGNDNASQGSMDD